MRYLENTFEPDTLLSNLVCIIYFGRPSNIAYLHNQRILKEKGQE